MKPILSIGVFLISVGVLLIIILIGVTNLTPERTNDLSVTQTAIGVTANDLNQQQTAIASSMSNTSGLNAAGGHPELHVFVRGADGLLYHKALVNGEWSNWQSLPVPSVGITKDSPSAIIAPDGHIDLFVRGNDNALWHDVLEPNGNPGNWESLSGNLTSGPAAIGRMAP